jgi:hypothetical protein
LQRTGHIYDTNIIWFFVYHEKKSFSVIRMSKEPSQLHDMVRRCYSGRRGNNPCYKLKMCQKKTDSRMTSSHDIQKIKWSTFVIKRLKNIIYRARHWRVSDVARDTIWLLGSLSGLRNKNVKGTKSTPWHGKAVL